MDMKSNTKFQELVAKLREIFQIDRRPRPISWCKSSGEAGSVGWERSLQ